MYDMREEKEQRMNNLITSIKNEKVKFWRKLHKRKGRKEAKAFLIEGYHLIEEAWKSKEEIIEVIVQDTVEPPYWSKAYPVEIVTEQVFQQITQTATPQGIAAIVAMKDVKNIAEKHIILIDAVQDPGNLGTIIRSADAAGMDAVVLGKGTVDLYNDKVIRATQGSLFHIPVYEADLIEEITALKKSGFEIWATALEEAEAYNKVKIPEKVAIILGNEGAGIDKTLIETAEKRVVIPIYGKAESLNVGIAAAILMYHLKS